MYCHSSCNWRFVSDCKVSIVGTRWTAEKAHTVRSQVDLWRLFVLPFFVQLEIRVRLQSEYCMFVVKSLRLRKWICGGCLYCHSSCNWRFMSDCKVSIVGTQGYAEKVHTVRSQVDLWRLFVLPFFVQLESRVRLQSEYCLFVVKSLRLRK